MRVNFVSVEMSVETVLEMTTEKYLNFHSLLDWRADKIERWVKYKNLNVYGYNYLRGENVEETKRWIETGKGPLGSVFTDGEGTVVKALKVDKTVGGLQIWKLTIYRKSGFEEKTVYLKNRKELKNILDAVVK